MRDPLLELLPGPGIPVHGSITALRAAVAKAVAELATVPDSALESPWPWRSDDPKDADVRYGFYRIHERLEEASAAIPVGMAGGEGRRMEARLAADGVGPAVGLLAAATAARWELHGALAGITDSEIDADPRGREWTIRQTLAHIVNSQRAYGWYTAWWVNRGAIPEPLPEQAGDASMPELPEEGEEGSGSLPEILGRLDDLVDLAASRFALVREDVMAIPARWSGLPVTVGFRIGRWGSHIREHTIQVDKTAAMIGRHPSEVERLIRLIRTSQGRLEGFAFARTAQQLEAPLTAGGSTADILIASTDEIGTLARGIAASAHPVQPAS